MRWTDAIRTVPDFPKKGILFYDITPVLADKKTFNQLIREMTAQAKPHSIDAVAAIESRGFIFGAILAEKLGTGFIPIRKQGKLPHKKISQSYELEYGQATLEIHNDAAKTREHIWIIDDVLATGGTAHAAAKLVEQLGAHVSGIQFPLELGFLNGRQNLAKYDVFSLQKIGEKK